MKSLSTMKRDITNAAFLGMFALWAYNIDLDRTDWIWLIWGGNPQQANRFTSTYRKFIIEGDDGMLAVIRFICNLDHDNLAVLAFAIEKFVQDGCPRSLFPLEEIENEC